MYHPASLRSDGGRPRLEGVATFPWSTWQASLGMSGNLPVDSVATFPWIGWQKSVEYAVWQTSYSILAVYGSSLVNPSLNQL